MFTKRRMHGRRGLSVKHAQLPRVYTAHLNARQRLVGPDGVASNHVDPVVVNGDARLVLTCGGGRQARGLFSSSFNPAKRAETLTTHLGKESGPEHAHMQTEEMDLIF